MAKSSKSEFLEQFHIYYGGDMTIDAACAKLSYLLSKGFTRNEIKALIKADMRGERTDLKTEDQF
jgi:hypothetical protein